MRGAPVSLPVATAIVLADLRRKLKKSASGSVLIHRSQIDSLVAALEAAAPTLLDRVEANERDRAAVERAKKRGRAR